jgi:tetratricopeptide (TPR) repeat protein
LPPPITAEAASVTPDDQNRPPATNTLPQGHVSLPAGEVLVVASEYVEAGRIDAAERLADHILRSIPGTGQALQLKGLIAYKRGRHPEAAALIEAGIAAGAATFTDWRNLSELYRLVMRLDDALGAARKALALNAADPLNFFNLAMVLYERMDINGSLGAARTAIEMRPNLPEARMKLAQVLLAKGEFTEGWEQYEWRYKIPGAAPLMPPTEVPQWDGQRLAGPLLLIGDQGYGDVVQFMRYLPWVKSRTDQILVATSTEMHGIVAQIAPGIAQFHKWEDIPPYAAFCPLSGLPRLHGTTLDTIPVQIPYVRADPALATDWKAQLDARIPAGKIRVGIAWAGRPTHNNDINRTTALESFRPFANVPGVALVSLQKGPGAAQADGFPIINLDAEIQSFEDTIAIIDGLDLVLAVDTSIIHMAAAMGKPTWVMLPFAPDFRWLTDRTDSPWYPTLRLFRHPEPRRWDILVPQVAAALTEFVGSQT